MTTDNSIHIYPINDTKPHNLNGKYCGCEPVETDRDGVCVIIHNAWDGREFYESFEDADIAEPYFTSPAASHEARAAWKGVSNGGTK